MFSCAGRACPPAPKLTRAKRPFPVHQEDLEMSCKTGKKRNFLVWTLATLPIKYLELSPCEQHRVNNKFLCPSRISDIQMVATANKIDK